MEAWFLADPNNLEQFYGEGFRRNALSSNPQMEQIRKADVMSSLKDASKNTAKGEYHKTGHAPAILALVDAQKVRNAAPNCERLFREVLSKLD